MYGHTLLRIDPPAHRGATTLASYALNFAAQTNESNGLMFAVKGLTGFYKGPLRHLALLRQGAELWRHRES
ncbi:MAG: DUF4105 domain-containing protein [Gammaproteobacteria bacterium]|nr:DUF4105 domain-containing protein [Gammaproteobacteria bacterium]